MNQSTHRIYAYDRDLHGSSEYATRAHLKQRRIGPKGKLFLGYELPTERGVKRLSLGFTTQKHVMTCGPTRSSKCVSASGPRCLDHEGPLIVCDVKDGELALIAAKYRREFLKRNVVIIDPYGVVTKHLGTMTARFNPISQLDPESDSFFDDAMLHADSLVIVQNVRDPYWIDEAQALIAGLLMYIRVTPLEAFPTQKKSRDLAQLRRLISLTPDDFRELVCGKYKEDEDGNKTLIKPGMLQSDHEEVANVAGRIMNKAPKEFSGVLSTAQQNTHFLEAQCVQQALSDSDFSMQDIENGNTDVFIVLPVKRLRTQKRFIRLFINIFINAVTGFEKQHKHPYYFVIEEFGSLGRLDVALDAFSLMAGYNVQLHIIVQDLSQLAGLYQERWQSFIANSGILQFFATRDPFTAEYISKLCGMTTVTSLSEGSAAMRSRLTGDPHYLTREDTLHSRRLITPEEIMVLHPALQILLFDNTDPILALKTAYFLDQRYYFATKVPRFSVLPKYADRPQQTPIDFTHPRTPVAVHLEQIFMDGARL